MRFVRTTYARTWAMTAALLTAVVLVAVVACAAAPRPMAHSSVAPCVAAAHGDAGAQIASSALVMPVAAAPHTPTFTVVSFASRAPASTDIASLGVPPDDPLHGLLLL